MTKQSRKTGIAIVVILLLSAGVLTVRILLHSRSGLSSYVRAEAAARISPDYAGVVIPPNIAPLNFVINEPGRLFCARVFDESGRLRIEVFSRDGRIRMPQRTWQQILQEARGKSLSVEPFVRDATGKWRRFEPFSFHVASESIDEYLFYRMIHPGYNEWNDVVVYQRRISTFEQTEILHSHSAYVCMNCHTFSSHKSGRMVLQIRHPQRGPSMIVAADGKLRKVDLRTERFPRTPSFTSWHPNGNIIAFSQNRFTQYFHTGGRDEPRDVVDMASDLGIYRLNDASLVYSPKISRPDRLETYPEWSNDGKHLYFCSAQVPWETTPDIVEKAYEHWPKIKYDLMRVEFAADTCSFGQVETLLSSEETSKSMTQPRVSPDGRWLIFVMHNYGTWPVFQDSADLWMLDLQVRKARRMSEINTDRTESWHGWSSNGRWIVFSSKRDTGTLSRPYFSYIDADGKASKPMLLPQEDPTFYNRFYNNFNLPELSAYPAPVGQHELAQLVNRPDRTEKGLLMTSANPVQKGPKNRIN